MVEYDFEGGRLRLSSWNIDEDEELMIADDLLEKKEEESLIQKFSEMEIEEEDQEVQELPQGACARKLI